MIQQAFKTNYKVRNELELEFNTRWNITNF